MCIPYMLINVALCRMGAVKYQNFVKGTTISKVRSMRSSRKEDPFLIARLVLKFKPLLPILEEIIYYISIFQYIKDIHLTIPIPYIS